MARANKVYDLASFKALPEAEGKGSFSALVSVYDNVDLQGDRVVRGAFENSLKRWQKSGDPIPVIWSHDWANPMSHIGYADPKDVTETDRGLLVKGQLDIESNPFAKQVYDLLKHRRVKEFSFAYDIQDERRAKDGANELMQVGIIEVGPTLKGANPDTELLAVKSLKDAEVEWVKAKMEEYGLAPSFEEQAVVATSSTAALAFFEMKAGNPAALIEWFNAGADGQINWGESGDFDACVAVASEHMDEDQAKGFCNERHQDAVGGAPGSEDKKERAKAASLKLAKMHDTLLALGYTGCVSESSVDGQTDVGVKAQTEALGEGAVKEPKLDEDLRLRTLLAEMSQG